MSAIEVAFMAALSLPSPLVLAQVLGQEAAYPIGSDRRTKMSLPGMAYDSAAKK
jgi:hypothetical protein